MSYSLTQGANYEIELNDSIKTATEISVNSPYTGRFQLKAAGPDVDYYKLTVDVPGDFTLNLKHASAYSLQNSLNYFNLEVFDVDDFGILVNEYFASPITSHDRQALDFKKTLTLPIGTYYVKVNCGTTFTEMDYNLTVFSFPTTSTYYTVATSVISGSGTITPITYAPSGSGVTITVAPANGYKVDSLFVDGAQVTLSNNSYTLTNILKDYAVKASFSAVTIADPQAFMITASAGNGGTITPSGTATLGGAFTVNVAPNEHYKFCRLVVNGVDVTSKMSGNSYTINNIMADMSVQASFTPVYWGITASAGTGGSVGTTSTLVMDGANYFVNVRPDAGYYVKTVTVDGADVLALVLANGGYQFQNVTADHAMTVTFGAIPTFTITATAGAGGSISPTQSVQSGRSVVYYFSPAAGYAISNVKVDGNSVGAPTFYSFTNVTANHTIEVTFANSLTLTTSGANGTISINGTVITGSASVAAGSSPVVNVVPNAHYQLYRLMVGSSNVTSKVVGGNYTISNILANTAVSATFTPIYWSISGSAGTGGKVSVGSILVQDGSNYYVSITPTKGYKIADVTDNGVSVVGQISGGGYNILNITGSHTIIAIFVLI